MVSLSREKLLDKWYGLDFVQHQRNSIFHITAANEMISLGGISVNSVCFAEAVQSMNFHVICFH